MNIYDYLIILSKKDILFRWNLIYTRKLKKKKTSNLKAYHPLAIHG